MLPAILSATQLTRIARKSDVRPGLIDAMQNGSPPKGLNPTRRTKYLDATVRGLIEFPDGAEHSRYAEAA